MSTVYTPRDVEGLPMYRMKVRKIEKEKLRLKKRRTLLENKIHELEQITEFYKDIPLNIVGTDSRIDMRSIPDCNRTVYIYHNAHVPDDVDNWGIQIYNFSAKNSYDREKWLGTGYTKEQALKVAKDWVASGVLPEEKP